MAEEKPVGLWVRVVGWSSYLRFRGVDSVPDEYCASSAISGEYFAFRDLLVQRVGLVLDWNEQKK